MMNFYPLKAVVTTNPVLATLYDGDPYSAFLTSGCVTPDELSKLLDQGASFDALVFVDGEGQNLVGNLEGSKMGVNAKDIHLETFAIDRLDAPGAVKRIHELLKAQRGLFDIGG